MTISMICTPHGSFFEFIHFIRYTFWWDLRESKLYVTLADNDFNLYCVFLCTLLPHERQLSIVNKGYLTAAAASSAIFTSFLVDLLHTTSIFEIVEIWWELN